MVLQFEDVVDTLKSLFWNTYKYIFHFDHSSGHDKTCPDGLCASNMSKGFGGKQSRMRKKMIENETYLGPFDHAQKLKVGQTQLMIFQDTNIGPFYLSKDERVHI